jgi:hypothetical protein
MHRWVWDLHYPAPQSARHEYPIAAIPHDTPRLPQGPSALPGEYSVRLTANGHSYSAALIVKMDPRVKTPLADLGQQFRLETRLASMMNTIYQGDGQASSLSVELEKLAARARGPVAESIAALQKKVMTLLGQPGGFMAAPSREVTLLRVSDEIGTLYREMGRADLAPTASQVSAVAEVERDFSGLMTLWNVVKTTDLPTLNQQLKSANLPEIQLEQGAEPELEEEE